MKRILTVLILVIALVIMSMPVSAVHFWNYDIRFYAAYGTPTIDGIVSPGEWDAAPVIEIRLNNCPLYAQGFVVYQNQWAGARDDADYSGNYRIMWDMNYIYFLEERTDDHVNLSHHAEQPWYTDGVLVFTQVDSADGRLNPEGISVHIFWTVGNGNGAIGGDVRARIANMESGERDIVEIPGARIASSLVPGGYVVEVAIPWAFYREFAPNFTPSAGTIMGISYVIHDSDADVQSHEKQILFPFDEALVAETPGGYDFGGWGTLELLPAPVVTLPAQIEVEDTPAPIAADLAAPAPQTGTAVYAVIAIAVAAGVVLVIFAKKRKNAGI